MTPPSYYAFPFNDYFLFHSIAKHNKAKVAWGARHISRAELSTQFVGRRYGIKGLLPAAARPNAAWLLGHHAPRCRNKYGAGSPDWMRATGIIHHEKGEKRENPPE